MRVVCDNCGAVYKIPESKLVREVNKATCRKCGHGIIIRKTGIGPASTAPELADGEATQITSADELEARARAQQTAAAGMPAASFPPFGGRQDLPIPEEVVPPTVVDQRPDGHEQTVPRAGRGAPGPVLVDAPPPPPAAQLPPAAVTSAPPAPPLRQAPQPSISQATPALPAQPSAPMPIVTQAPVVQSAHDPSGDMTLVMMSAFGGLVGSAVLAVSQGNVMLTSGGLAICIASGFTALLVLVTGDRGRKEARVFLSMFLSLPLAAIVGLCWFVMGMAGSLSDDLADLEVAEAEVPAPSTEPGPLEEAIEGSEDAIDPLAQLEEDTAVEKDEEEVAEAPAPAPRPSTKPTESTTSTNNASTSPKPTPKPTPRPDPEPKPTPKASSAPQGVPVTVLDTMLKSNKGVKRCFGIYRQDHGSLPTGRITVKLVVSPSGRASSAKIDGGQYAGTSLDTCLGSAVKEITFPPWDGSESLTYYYPFIMG